MYIESNSEDEVDLEEKQAKEAENKDKSQPSTVNTEEGK